MTQPSAEQFRIIQAPIAPMSVIACAGSGKTFTAVRRLAEMREQLGAHRGRVALLSFSNIAVDTFRQEYQKLAQNTPAGVASDRVEINTLDSFIATNVLHPHAHRTMGAQQGAFLVTGGEAFLACFNFPTETYPREITKMQAGIADGEVYFYYQDINQTQRLNTERAKQIVHRLGRAGAYTHNLGRYWCYRTLAEQPGILRALAHRYPHLLMDEAQDIGTVHQAIIEQLIGAGCTVSLIGDPNQGIYEFAGANGRFLTEYGERQHVESFALTRNFRSIPAVVNLANNLSMRADSPNREAPNASHGVYFIPYRNAERDQLITAFRAAVLDADLELERSAVLCRGREMVNKLAGNQAAPGQGLVKRLAQAAILRDQHYDFHGAFNSVVTAIVALLADPPARLASKLTQPGRLPEYRALRRLIWTYTRSVDGGLPAATHTANTQWHQLLLERTRSLLASIEREHQLMTIDNIGRKLSRRGLPNNPIIIPGDLAENNDLPSIRADTVHQAKGESLDAVLYLANRQHIDALLAGVTTEVGRIGYVAATRTRNLLWLGVPANALEELRPTLLECGFQERNV